MSNCTSDCGDESNPIRSMIRGPQGPAGPAGATGPQGPAGLPGATGASWTPSLTVLDDAPTIASDGSTARVFEVTLGGNRTLGNPTGMVAGATYLWIVKQDATGGRALGFGSAFKFPGGVAPVLSTAANAVDIVTGVSDGANVYCNALLAFS